MKAKIPEYGAQYPRMRSIRYLLNFYVISYQVIRSAL
ncbi:hypothetical protein [Vulcanisaeta moutnovskia]|nr:hypothetical protein [Vulcanisaeta moutnovskia]